MAAAIVQRRRRTRRDGTQPPNRDDRDRTREAEHPFVQNVASNPGRMRAEALLRFPHPILVCDVGGTNVRFAACAAPGDRLRPVTAGRTESFAGLGDAASAALRGDGLAVRSLIVCAAGPVEGARVHLTNARWTIDGPTLAEELGLAQGLLLNDFEAQAVALPHIPDEATRTLNPGAAQPDGTRLVLGPGTGLGAAGLFHVGGKWLPATSEAGHVSLGPAQADEEAIWPHLERVEGRVTFESVLSGPGLARLYAAVRAARGLGPNRLAENEIAPAARAGDATAEETMRLFWRLAARCAGDLALIFMARGGVTLAGGVLPRLVDWFDVEAFRSAFTDKAPMAALAADMPVRLLTARDTVLTGLAALAAAPETYALDYARRAWRPA